MGVTFYPPRLQPRSREGVYRGVGGAKILGDILRSNMSQVIYGLELSAPPLGRKELLGAFSRALEPCGITLRILKGTAGFPLDPEQNDSYPYAKSPLFFHLFGSI